MEEATATRSASGFCTSSIARNADGENIRCWGTRLIGGYNAPRRQRQRGDVTTCREMLVRERTICVFLGCPCAGYAQQLLAKSARPGRAVKRNYQHDQTAIHIPSLSAAATMSGQFGSNQQLNFDQASFAPKQDMEYLCAGQLCAKITLRNRRSPSLPCPHPCPAFYTDCGAKNAIKSREPIRCRECGHRIMYKKRTKRSMWCICCDTRLRS